MAEVTLVGRLPWHGFRVRRDDGDGRDDDQGGGQKTVTIVTTVTGHKKPTHFGKTELYHSVEEQNKKEI